MNNTFDTIKQPLFWSLKSKYFFVPVIFWAFFLCSFQCLAEEMSSSRQSSAFPLVLTDMAGRKVTLPRPARRIVTTFKPATLSVFCLGLSGRLVGVDDSSRRDSLHRALLPGIGRIAGVGKKSAGINFETLVALGPDLVILYAQEDGLELADRLALLNIPAMVILPETFETIQSSMEIIARAAGVKSRMDVIVSLMEEVLTTLDHGLSGLPEDRRVTGYFSSTRGLFTTATGQMLQNEIFQRAGITNVSGNLTGYFQTVSPEQLVQW
ncbi:MAG: ABC transporter substrate-binding protein, partial [Desulfobacterales bacterium]|nr:ABC transporter substrate-binding protein [Desulfobacterales bacterium]